MWPLFSYFFICIISPKKKRATVYTAALNNSFAVHKMLNIYFFVLRSKMPYPPNITPAVSMSGEKGAVTGKNDIVLAAP